MNLDAAPEIPLQIQLGGTVTNPVVKADVGTLTSSVAQGAQQAGKQAVEQKVDSAAMRVVQERTARTVGEVEARIFEPQLMVQVTGREEIAPIAAEADQRLTAVLAALPTAD